MELNKWYLAGMYVCFVYLHSLSEWAEGSRQSVGTHPIVLEVRRVVEGARGAAAVQVGVVGAVHHLGAAHRHPARRRRPIAASARPTLCAQPHYLLYET